jgi:hypothetical protein
MMACSPLSSDPIGEAGRRGIGQQAWVLIGAVAETLSSVREYRDGEDVISTW